MKARPRHLPTRFSPDSTIFRIINIVQGLTENYGASSSSTGSTGSNCSTGSNNRKVAGLLVRQAALAQIVPGSLRIGDAGPLLPMHRRTRNLIIRVIIVVCCAPRGSALTGDRSLDMLTKIRWKPGMLLAIPGLLSGLISGCSSNQPAEPRAAMAGGRACGTRVGQSRLAVPCTDAIIGANWGRMKPMAQAQHRPWAMMTVHYFSGVVKHNPVYLWDLDACGHFRNHPPSFRQEAIGLGNIPWFYANLAITPVLMCFNPPWAQVCSVPRCISPIYEGHLPLQGVVAPVPESGRIDWPYPVVHISGESAPQK